VKGVEGGLAIKGTSTFNFHIKKREQYITYDPKQQKHTWFEKLPPVAPILGIGGTRHASSPERDKD
jgi:hypothetical protein